MRIAAHHMVRSLTAGMVMITCRDPLYMSLTTNLRNAFLATLRVSGKFLKNFFEYNSVVFKVEKILNFKNIIAFFMLLDLIEYVFILDLVKPCFLIFISFL